MNTATKPVYHEQLEDEVDALKCRIAQAYEIIQQYGKQGTYDATLAGKSVQWMADNAKIIYSDINV